MLRKLTVSYGPTEMLYRPIGASQGGLPAGSPPARAMRTAEGEPRAAGFRGGRVRYTPCTRPLHKLAFCSLGRREASSKVSLVYCGLFETESVLEKDTRLTV